LIWRKKGFSQNRRNLVGNRAIEGKERRWIHA